jgi:hypothetical protein
LQAIVEGWMPWLLGHAVLGQVTWPSVVLAVTFSLSYGAALALADGRQRSPAWFIGGQAVAVVILVVRGQVLPAIPAVLLLLPQLYLQAYLYRDGGPQWYLHRVQPFVMTIMILAAFTL